MQEVLLHYLWRYQKFSHPNLVSTSGKELGVVHTGTPNTGGGPDFSGAQIFYDGLLWNGPVEVHLKSSDWYRHNHHLDPNYENVILHVIWEQDVEVAYPNGKNIPTLQLRDVVDSETLDRHERLFRSLHKKLPCESEIYWFSNFQWQHWLERLYVERVEERVAAIDALVALYKRDWERVLFVLLFKAYGLNVNGTAFYESAQSIPIAVVRKLVGNPLDMEALFMGQSGLLEGILDDAYQKELKKRYEYVKTKFNLVRPEGLGVQFARLRPSNFPTLRLAQLAALYTQQPTLFQEVIRHPNPDVAFATFAVVLEGYWKIHYNFGSQSAPRIKKFSRSFFDLIAINTLLPIRYAYTRYLGGMGEEDLFRWVEKIPQEHNRITKLFDQLKVPIQHAGDSQGILHLFKNYCQKHKCVSCNVGFHLMKL